MLKMIDLFSGIGGFSLAARWAGIDTVQFVEIEPYCQKKLARIFPGIPIHDDVKTFKGDKFGTVDIITAGVPCQPASQSGKRKGTADDRWLWDEAIRVFTEIHPTWAIFENVDGLLTLKSGMEFELLLSQMEVQGYETQSYFIPACGVGAPHKRNRVWIIAHSNRLGCRYVEKEQTEIISNQIGKLSLAKQGRDIEQCGTGQSDCHVANPQGEHDRRYFRGTQERQIQESGISSQSGIIADSKKTECQLAGSTWSRRIGLTDKNSDVTHPDTKGLAERKSQSGNDGKECETAIRGDWGKGWYETATRLCRMDDGLPSWLSKSERGAIYRAVKYFGREETEQKTGIDCSKVNPHRVEQLKALGNSIVPQIAYQFLSGIVEIEDQLLAEAA